MTKLLMLAFVGLAMLTGVALLLPASAQDGREAQLIGFHQLCDRGDRRACIRFGMMLQQFRDRHDGWRRSHPEFWWWER